MKDIIVAGLLTATVVGSAALAHEEQPARRSIAVPGSAEVTARPDRARLALAVEVQHVEVKAAEAEVNKVTRAVLAEVRALGTKDEHVATAGLSIQPEYVWDEERRINRLTGYRARRDIEVRVLDLEKLGDYLLRATKAGVNQVSPPVLESSRADEHERTALANATADARANAEAIAQALGVRLGTIRSLDATPEMRAPPPMPYKAMALPEMAQDSGNAQMGLATGEITFSATVRAEFDVVAP